MAKQYMPVFSNSLRLLRTRCLLRTRGMVDCLENGSVRITHFSEPRNIHPIDKPSPGLFSIPPSIHHPSSQPYLTKSLPSSRPQSQRSAALLHDSPCWFVSTYPVLWAIDPLVGRVSPEIETCVDDLDQTMLLPSLLLTLTSIVMDLSNAVFGSQSLSPM